VAGEGQPSPVEQKGVFEFFARSLVLEIKGFLETSFVDWPERICAVLFLPYCNFRCPYCHNHELVLSPGRFATLSWDFIRGRLKTLADWLEGVCVTGGEPTLHPDLPDLLSGIKSLGFPVKLDTNGSRPQVLRFLVREGLVDFVAMDVKGPLETEQYSRCAGVRVDLQPIRESIDFLMSGPVPYQFRTTVVPHIHSPEIMARLSRDLQDARQWARREFRAGDVMDPEQCGRTSPDPGPAVH
jgi:pyruvate formate lyase activating enzyme